MDVNRIYVNSPAEVDTPARKISGMSASYPTDRAARLKSGNSVSVRLGFVVTETGEVTDVRVVESAGRLVDEAVAERGAQLEVQPGGEEGHEGQGARRFPPDLPRRLDRPMAKLIVNPTSSARREISLARSLISIGRDPSNDVVLPDAMVSRRHAVIEFRGSQYFLRDCNSSNGSLVNGDRVSERNLRDGDLVAIGTARMLFREELDAEDSAAKVVQHPSAPRLHCPQCQADYRKGDQFCRQCGTSVAPAAAGQGGVRVLRDGGDAAGEVLQRLRPRAAAGRRGRRSDRGRDRDRPPPRRGSAGRPIAARSAAAGRIAPTPRRRSRPGAAGRRRRPAGVRRPRPAPAQRRARRRRPRWRSRRRRGARLRARRHGRQRGAVRARPALDAAAARRRRAHRDRVARRARPPRPASRVRLVAGVIDLAIVAALQALLLTPVARHWWARELPATPADVPYFPILVSLAMVPIALVLGRRLLRLLLGAEGRHARASACSAWPWPPRTAPRPSACRGRRCALLGYLASGLLLGIGFLMIAFGGTALHDRIAGTRVVRRGTVG